MIVLVVTYIASEGYGSIVFENPVVSFLSLVAYLFLIAIIMANRELRYDWPANYAVYTGSCVCLGMFFGTLAAEIKSPPKVMVVAV